MEKKGETFSDLRGSAWPAGLFVGFSLLRRIRVFDDALKGRRGFSHNNETFLRKLMVSPSKGIAWVTHALGIVFCFPVQHSTLHNCRRSGRSQCYCLHAVMHIHV